MSSDSLCTAITDKGKACKRFVSAGSKFCWQHASGWKRKLKSLTGNQSLLFGLTVAGVVLGGISVLAWFFPDFWKKHESPLKADLSLLFFGRDRLRFDYRNTGEISGRSPKHWFGVLDLSRPFWVSPNQPNGLPVLAASEANDFVRPGDAQGNEDVLNTPIAQQHVQLGDKLWGAGWVTCENCGKTRAYYFYFEVGKGGWYAEVSDTKKMELPKPLAVPATDSAIAVYADRLVPKNLRIPIPQSVF